MPPFPPWFVACVQAVNQWWSNSGLEAYQGRRDSGSLRTLTVREGVRTGDRLVMLTVSGNPAYSIDQKQIQAFVDQVKKAVEPENPGRLSIFLRVPSKLQRESLLNFMKNCTYTATILLGKKLK